MRKIKMHQIDAFADSVFSGNPAAVCILDAFLSDDEMQQIALENQLSETAFAVQSADENVFDLRWFSPVREVDLCGHATLATAFVLDILGRLGHEVHFQTRSGLLTVRKTYDGRYHMDFPADEGRTYAGVVPEGILDALTVTTIIEGRDDVAIIVANEEEVLGFEPPFHLIKSLPKRGLIVSGPGTTYDFVSRCFYPAYGVDEDPATGSAHTLLTPYWAIRLKKNSLSARQASQRGGRIQCVYRGKRVSLIGNAVRYLEGEIFLPG